MGNVSSIEWTEATWNPVRGCTRVSPGCESCYAERVAARFSGPGQPYHRLAVMGENGPRWTRVVRTVPERLADPVRWKKPRRIFVNSMSDLFHEGLTNEEIAAVFGVMAACPRHTFQVLTKRAERMREWFEWAASHAEWLSAMGNHAHEAGAPIFKLYGRPKRSAWNDFSCQWPLPNVWLGVSVEDQKRADERIPELLRLPSRTLKFVSYEPALGPVDFAKYLKPTLVANSGERLQHPDPRVPGSGGTWEWGLDWIIVGGESGPGSRPFDVWWARHTIRQCRQANVACFVKQLGSQPYDSGRSLVPAGATVANTRIHLLDRKGGNIEEWPIDLPVRQWPASSAA